jgi:hypothetical protein
MPLDITEYTSLASDSSGNVIPTGLEPSRLVQQVQITGASAQSAAVGDVTRFVRIHTDATCRIAFGANPTATSGSQRLQAGGTEFFGVRPGTKIAVISST